MCHLTCQLFVSIEVKTKLSLNNPTLNYVKPEEAVFIIQLYRCHRSGQVCHDPLEQSVMDRKTDEHLELVIFAKTTAGCLNLGDQLGVHPPQLCCPRDRAARPLG